MRIKRYYVSVLIIMVMLFSCEYRDIKFEIPVVIDEISFSTDINPIFKLQSCTNCHNGSLQPDLTTGNTYNSLISNGFIDTINPSESKIYEIPALGGKHPSQYTILQSQQILVWIEQGAKNN